MFFIKNKSLTVHGKKEAGMSVAIILSWSRTEETKHGFVNTVRTTKNS